MPYLLTILMFLMSSCSEIPLKPVVSISFMSPSEVRNSFRVTEGQALSSDNLTSQAKERVGHCLNEKEFFKGSKSNTVQIQVDVPRRLPPSADLRVNDSPVRSQWDGTCTAHGLQSVLDNKSHQHLSARHIWAGYKLFSCVAAIETWDHGGCITTNAAWSQDDVVSENAYNDPNFCYTRLTSTTNLGNNIPLIKESLSKGDPVYLGISVTKSLANCDVAALPKSANTGGGHALGIVGYRDDMEVSGGGYFIIKNSWGDQCGDHGYQYIPYSYCTRADMYCLTWSIDAVSVGDHSTVVVPKKRSCHRVWYAPWIWSCETEKAF